MVNNFVAIITARGGSKRLPHKNMLNLEGHPLLSYSINAAMKCPLISETYVTTESEEIKEISLKYGAKIIDRPLDLAQDLSLSSDVLLHAIEALEKQGKIFDHIALLQPTSPLRNELHLKECIELYLKSGSASVISVTKSEHHPFKSLTINEDETLRPLLNKKYLNLPVQQLPVAYRQNGAIYLVSVKSFKATKEFFIEPSMPYVMSQEASIDIDHESDLHEAEKIIRAVKRGHQVQ